MFAFNLKFACWFVGTLLVEILIGIYMHDRFIRPYVGDFLVVPLFYFALRSVLVPRPNWQLAGVLLFAYGVECSQYFNLINWLGLGNSSTTRLLYGTHFDWIDMLAYSLGAWVLYFVFNRGRINIA